MPKTARETGVGGAAEQVSAEQEEWILVWWAACLEHRAATAKVHGGAGWGGRR